MRPISAVEVTLPRPEADIAVTMLEVAVAPFADFQGASPNLAFTFRTDTTFSNFLQWILRQK